MSTRRKTLTRSALVLAGLAATAGCNGSFSGGGTMPAASGAGKAVTLMKVLCSPSTQQVTGVLAYADPSARVSVTSKILSPGSTFLEEVLAVDFNEFPRLAGNQIGKAMVPADSCDNDPSRGRYVGTYGQAGSLGTFRYAVDADSRCQSGYRVAVSFQGGRFAGYSNDGCVTGTIRPITAK
ncbi:MAG: hypothetical protein JWN87_2351 [Frankiales bacterium]|nr:hypothetical protein [Frankiales bacterium]